MFANHNQIAEVSYTISRIFPSWQAIEISRTDYEPSDTDILYAEGITSSNSVASLEFSCPKLERDSIVDSPIRHDPKMRLTLLFHPLIIHGIISVLKLRFSNNISLEKTNTSMEPLW